MRKIGIFGSTGSIGTQALDFLAGNDEFRVETLVAGSNARLLAEQARKFRPRYVGLLSERHYDKDLFSDLDCEVVLGADAYKACLDCDRILFSTVGCDALYALMAFVRAGKSIALANKECLVSAGRLIMDEAAISGAEIIPVDSEHSAIWQCLDGKRMSDVKEILLTASGGRYYTYPKERLSAITPEQAIVHPNWRMGKKISVDSATMMNKALELIEARWLFETKDVGYIIHPDSIIHSMVRMKDGAVFAQMSAPDMRLPISAALMYPMRAERCLDDLPFDKPLVFMPKREDVFFAPTLARYCIDKGGSSGATLDAANEAAVRLFLAGRITFDRIAEIVRDELYRADFIERPTVDDVVRLHAETVAKVIKDN